MKNAILAALICAQLALFAQSPVMTASDVEKLMSELSNWGRWGADDQTGTVHLITPAVRKAAAALVKDGVSISLSRPLDTEKAVDNPNPFVSRWFRSGQFLMDEYTVTYHGFAHTHMDALAHMYVKEKGYRGVAAPASGQGPKSNAVANFSEGIFTRCVLVDIPRLKGVPYLEPGTPIYPSDLDAWEKATGTRIGPGDAVLIRTGRWRRRAEKGPWAASETNAGIHASCARWLKQRDIAVFGSDSSADVLPSRVEGVGSPVHELLLIAMGTPILDNCDLETLAEAAASRNRTTFLLVVAPLRVEAGTGSPVNPIATF